MPRIQPVQPVAPDGLEPLGAVTQVAQGIMEHRPAIAEALRAVGTAQYTTGTLPRRLRELVRLRIAFHNQCRSCMAVRYQPDVVDEGDVCSLERPDEATNLTDAEKAALRFADLFATNHLAIDDAVYDDLRQYYGEGELVELGVACAMTVGLGRLMSTWNMIELLPDSYRTAPVGEQITVWGHDDALVGAPRFLDIPAAS
jgi:alkylhydroperoxidase family enzyme